MICVHTYSSAARCPQIWKVSCTCVKGGYGRTWQVTLFSHHPEWQSLMCNQKLVPSSPLKPLSPSPAPVLRWPPTQGTCECQCQRQEILGGGFKSDDMTHRCEMTHFDTDHDTCRLVADGDIDCRSVGLIRQEQAHESTRVLVGFNGFLKLVTFWYSAAVFQRWAVMSAGIGLEVLKQNASPPTQELCKGCESS